MTTTGVLQGDFPLNSQCWVHSTVAQGCGRDINNLLGAVGNGVGGQMPTRPVKGPRQSPMAQVTVWQQAGETTQSWAPALGRSWSL
jgi:hypothetical protein